MKEALRVVGKGTPSVDALEKVTGAARYGADIKMAGLLQGRILRSPHPHARILNVDTAAAERLPGVRAVITAADTPRVLYGTILPDQYVLAMDKVRYIGDEVAAVAAVDAETAEEALELIDVTYEPLPAVFDLEAALAADAPQLHAHAPRNIADHIEFERGDVVAGRREAAVAMSQRFLTSVVHQCYLEPNACVAAFDDAGNLTLWAPNQGPFAAQMVLARALDIPTERVRVVQTYTGGAFGGKTWQQVWAICACLARKAGRPVRITLSREEEFEATLPRVPVIIDLTMGVRKDGTLAFKDSRVISGNGAYSVSAPAVNYVTATRHDSLYRLRNIHCVADLVYTNTVPTGMFRGFGNPQMHFAAESLLDMLAEELGMDAVEIRLRNAAQPGDTSAHGWYLGSCALTETIQEAAKATGWQEKRGKGGPHRGIGMASCIHVAGNRTIYKPYDGSNAEIRVTADGAVELLSGESDIGQGSRTVFAQIAAETLGVPLSYVRVAPVDTARSPFATGTVASRVTTLGGWAVQMGAANARQQILEAVAAAWDTAPDALEIVDGTVRVKADPARAISFPMAAEIAVDSQDGRPVVGVGEYRAEGVVLPDPKTKYGNIAIAYSFGTHVAEVEVDVETGQVRVLNFVAAHDVGRAINPVGVEGQIEGGVAQGIGYALLEEMKMDQGRVVNPDFLDYRIPTALDIPPIQSILVEPVDPHGPFGAKSIGETALVPTVPAIANAIYDAVGVRLTELPMTPDKILDALHERDSCEPAGTNRDP